MSQIAAFPYRDPQVEQQQAGPDRPAGLYVSRAFRTWLTSMQTVTQAAPNSLTVPTIHLVGKTASIAPTPMNLGSASGLVRITMAGHVTTAATVSSSLTLTVQYTSDAISVTQSVVTTANSTSAPISGDFLCWVDPGSPVSYATTYASSGGTPMAYSLAVHAEQL